MLKKRDIKIVISLIVFIIGIIVQQLNARQPINSQAKVQPTLPYVSITPIEREKEYAHVIRIVDGDTIEVQTSDSAKFTVRYIGMDTPEIHHPTKKVQCFGKEAADKNTEIVFNRDIYMVKDISETDRYGRLLRYIYVPNSEATQSALFVNEYLVKEGYAHAATFPPDVAYQDLFRQAEDDARTHRRGLWSSCL